jgi:hypothetical protein
MQRESLSGRLLPNHGGLEGAGAEVNSSNYSSKYMPPKMSDNVKSLYDMLAENQDVQLHQYS